MFKHAVEYVQIDENIETNHMLRQTINENATKLQ